MRVSQQLLAAVLLWSCAVGAALGAVWDVFRVIRVATTPRETGGDALAADNIPRFYRRALNVAAFIEDILFALIAAATVAAFVCHVNDGQLRWFTFAGTAAGFFVYYQTIGRLVMAVARTVTDFIRGVIAFVFTRILLPPFRAAAMLIFRAVKFTAKRTAGLAARISVKARQGAIIRRIKREARRNRKKSAREVKINMKNAKIKKRGEGERLVAQEKL